MAKGPLAEAFTQGEKNIRTIPIGQPPPTGAPFGPRMLRAQRARGQRKVANMRPIPAGGRRAGAEQGDQPGGFTGVGGAWSCSVPECRRPICGCRLSHCGLRALPADATSRHPRCIVPSAEGQERAGQVACVTRACASDGRQALGHLVLRLMPHAYHTSKRPA